MQQDREVGPAPPASVLYREGQHSVFDSAVGCNADAAHELSVRPAFRATLQLVPPPLVVIRDNTAPVAYLNPTYMRVTHRVLMQRRRAAATTARKVVNNSTLRFEALVAQCQPESVERVL